MNDAVDEAAGRLMEEALAQGNSVRVRVTGRSMIPFLNGGEIVTIEPSAALQPAIGDLVLFRDPHKQQLVVHRVLWVRSDGAVRAKGDGLKSLDAPVGRRDILGRVNRIEMPDGRSIDLLAPDQRRRSKRTARFGLLRIAIRKLLRI